MKSTCARLIVLPILALLVGCSANQHKRIPREAANAICGSPATLTAVTTMTIQGTNSNGAPFTQTYSFPNEQWRREEVLVSDAGAQRQITGIDGTLAYDIATTGPSRTSDDVTRLRRAAFFHNPIAYLEAVFADAGKLSNTRTEGNMEAVDMEIDGDTYSLFIDGTTKLPAKIVSKVPTPSGVMTMETLFGAYTTAYGYRLPSEITTRLGNETELRSKIERQFFGGAIGSLLAPAELTPPGAPNHHVTLGAQPFDRPNK